MFNYTKCRCRTHFVSQLCIHKVFFSFSCLSQHSKSAVHYTVLTHNGELCTAIIIWLPLNRKILFTQIILQKCQKPLPDTAYTLYLKKHVQACLNPMWSDKNNFRDSLEEPTSLQQHWSYWCVQMWSHQTGNQS